MIVYLSNIVEHKSCEPQSCKECNGWGQLVYWQGDYHTGGATGKNVREDCDVCGGSGLME